MQTNRRNILKAAAIAPVAIAATSIPAVALAEKVAAPVAAQYPWLWYVTHDQEIYHFAGETMAEAIQYAQDSGYGRVAECQKQDWNLSVDGDELLEMLQGRNEDLLGEDYEFIDCTKDQERDLGRMVTEAIYAWAKKHGISTTAWAFGGMRNEIDVAIEDEPAATHTQDKGTPRSCRRNAG